MNQNVKKILIGCSVVAVAVVLLLVFAVWFWLFREMPTLEVSLTLPSEATLDSTITMVVTTTNPHDEPVTLDSIDIDNTFLAAFQVLSVTPEATDSMELPVIEQRSWDFGREVQPGDTLAVSYTLKTVMEGHFVGNIDVCNSNQDFVTTVADIVVRE